MKIDIEWDEAIAQKHKHKIELWTARVKKPPSGYVGNTGMTKKDFDDMGVTEEEFAQLACFSGWSFSW